MKSLLVLACSEKKRPDRGLLPAIDRYDGPAFRVLRKFRREHDGHGLHVWVLSAEFGLIEESTPIPHYDRKMTKPRAAELAPGVRKALHRAVRRRKPHRVGLCLSKLYRSALAGVADEWPDGVACEWLGGGLGPRLAALKRWLHLLRADM